MNRALIIPIISLTLLLLGTKITAAQELSLEAIDTISTPVPTTTMQKINSSPLHNASLGPKATLSINNDLIDFNTLTPTNPLLRTSIVEADSKTSYDLLIYLDKFLTDTTQKFFIPNTSCDTGNCTNMTPGSWTSTLTYGLGVHCASLTKNATCSIQYLSNDQYSTIPTSITSIAIASSIGESKIKLNYKINISSTQERGFYQNTANYIMVPSL